MSEGKDKKKVKGGSLFGGLRGGSVSKEKLIEKTITIDEDSLGMITEIRKPEVMAVADMLADYGERIGYVNTAFVAKSFLKALRVNFVSHNRKGRKEFLEAWSAIMAMDLKQKQDTLDKLLGTGGR